MIAKNKAIEPMALFFIPATSEDVRVVFVPGLDRELGCRISAECLDESVGETCVRDQGDVEVHGSAAHLVAVRQLLVGEVLGNVDAFQFVTPGEGPVAYFRNVI